MTSLRENVSSDEDVWSDEFWEDAGQFDLLDRAVADVTDDARGVPSAGDGTDNVLEPDCHQSCLA